jgi:hypothetical protein
MPLRRMREESELLQRELARSQPDLQFLLVHAQSLLQQAEYAAEGGVHADTSPEDAEMIRNYLERKNR